MLLQYDILWIDDHEERFESIQDDVEDIIKKFFFKPNITFKTEMIDQDFDYSQFDLMLIDFNLKDSHTWLEIINAIRSQSLHTEILFYSQDSSFHNDLIDHCKDNHYLEWIFISDRDWFALKFDKVFQTTIKKIETINSLRWLIMAETSEVDHKLRKHLKGFEANSEDNKIKIKTIITWIIADWIDFNLKNWETEDILFDDRNKKKINSFRRCKILWKLFVDNNDDFQQYYSSVVKKRHDLWHVENSNRTTLTLDNWVIVTVDDAKEIRKKIIWYKNIFDSILA